MFTGIRGVEMTNVIIICNYMDKKQTFTPTGFQNLRE